MEILANLDDWFQWERFEHNLNLMHLWLESITWYFESHCLFENYINRFHESWRKLALQFIIDVHFHGHIGRRWISLNSGNYKSECCSWYVYHDSIARHIVIIVIIALGNGLSPIRYQASPDLVINVNWELRKQLQWNFEWIIIIFIQQEYLIRPSTKW